MPAHPYNCNQIFEYLTIYYLVILSSPPFREVNIFKKRLLSGEDGVPGGAVLSFEFFQ